MKFIRNLWKTLKLLVALAEKMDKIEEMVLLIDHNLNLLSEDFREAKVKDQIKAIPNRRFVSWQDRAEILARREAEKQNKEQ